MSVLEFDFTQSRLPRGIRVARCRRFEGLCVEAVRAFAPDERVHRYPLQLVSGDTEVRFLTDLGLRDCNFDDHCVEIGPESLEGLEPELLEQMAAASGADPEDPEDLFQRITGGGERRFVLGFDDLLNHSSAPNCRFQLSPSAREGREPQPIAWGELYAQRAIAAGEELTLDYRTFYGPDWELPAGWAR